MLVHYKPGDSRLPQRGAFAPTPTSQLYQHWNIAAFTVAPQLKPLCFSSVICLCQKPSASRAYYSSMFYQCFVGDFLIFCRPAQKSCPPVFPVPPVLRRWFRMAEKYNLPVPGTRPLFFRLPWGRGGVVTGTGYPFAKPARRPPVTWFNGLGAVLVSVIGTHQH